MQKIPLPTSKFCHKSDLKITKCTEEKSPVEGGMWKTRWKVWKSTPKTGVDAGLLNFLHRVFNMWKKVALFTACIQGVLWKTLSAGQTDGYPPRLRATLFSVRPRRTGGQRPGQDKFSGRKPPFLWQRKAAYGILQDESIADSVKLRNFPTQCVLR